MLSNLFFILSLFAAIVLAMACTAILASPYAPNWGMVFFMVGSGMAVFLLFLLPQVGIHRIMHDYKYELLRRLAPSLEKTVSDVLKHPLPKNLEHFEKLGALHDRIGALKEWPFNMQQLIGLLGAIFIPVILFGLQVVLPLLAKNG